MIFLEKVLHPFFFCFLQTVCSKGVTIPISGEDFSREISVPSLIMRPASPKKYDSDNHRPGDQGIEQETSPEFLNSFPLVILAGRSRRGTLEIQA